MEDVYKITPPNIAIEFMKGLEKRYGISHEEMRNMFYTALSNEKIGSYSEDDLKSIAVTLEVAKAIEEKERNRAEIEAKKELPYKVN